MPLGTNTVWDRTSEAHVHWVPSNSVLAIALRSTASYPHERAAQLDTVKCQDRVDKRLSRVVYAWSMDATRYKHRLAQARE